jgi:hypothetical protein
MPRHLKLPRINCPPLYGGRFPATFIRRIREFAWSGSALVPICMKTHTIETCLSSCGAHAFDKTRKPKSSQGRSRAAGGILNDTPSSEMAIESPSHGFNILVPPAPHATGGSSSHKLFGPFGFGKTVVEKPLTLTLRYWSRLKACPAAELACAPVPVLAENLFHRRAGLVHDRERLSRASYNRRAGGPYAVAPLGSPHVSLRSSAWTLEE